MIIDIHSHIGDILNNDGGKLISKKGLTDRNLFDRPTKIRDFSDTGYFAGLLDYEHRGKEIPPLMKKWNVISSTKRNASATYENFLNSMNGSNTDYACVLPVPPYVTFDDIIKIKDFRIIPFTGIDFTKDYNIDEALKNDVESGAKGLKLHPILQKVALTNDHIREVVEIFGKYNLPILFHSGKTGYYRGKDSIDRQKIEFGNIDDAKVLIQSYPTIPFIIGHSGITHVNEVIEKLSGFENAYVDTSFQPIHKIIELINRFGENKVMYASDWPYGSRTRSIEVMKKACGSANKLENKVFFDNAYKLMRLDRL